MCESNFLNETKRNKMITLITIYFLLTFENEFIRLIRYYIYLLNYYYLPNTERENVCVARLVL